ncbi:MAG TPA: hypothetical protein VFZ77_05475 [Acidimicrobiales bacterium]
MTDPSARGAPWWEAVADAIAERDPWADRIEPASDLTDEQRAVLVGFGDQPPVPRLHGLGAGDQPPVPRPAPATGAEPGTATGSVPGDGEHAAPYVAGTEEDDER